MLTEAAAAINSDQARVGLWLSVTELARARGISKPAVTQALKRWSAAGVVITTRKDGKALLVNVAEFDRARGGEVADPAHVAAEATKKAADAGAELSGPAISRERARREAYEADLAMLKRDELLGRLVPVDELESAAIACGEAAVRAIDAIVNRAEDIAEAVAKNGVPGARVVLKDIARDIRKRLTDEFSRLPMAAMTITPATDKVDA